MFFVREPVGVVVKVHSNAPPPTLAGVKQHPSKRKTGSKQRAAVLRLPQTSERVVQPPRVGGARVKREKERQTRQYKIIYFEVYFYPTR